MPELNPPFSRPPAGAARPRLAIIVIVYNMAREAPRTLYSLCARYQRDVDEADYEVIVVDNGSSPRLDLDVSVYGRNFRYIYIEDASPSPAGAINFGAARSTAPNVAIMIDGARMASPGAVALGLEALERFPRPVVGTIGLHLGPDVQMRSVMEGYCQEVEDELLDSVNWKEDGYRLFSISSVAGSAPDAWLSPINESNMIFLPRSMYDELGGYDERFEMPGGGIVNLDFYERAANLPGRSLITLFGEGSFHQVHGGVMTNTPDDQRRDNWKDYHEHYRSLYGRPFKASRPHACLFGPTRPEALSFIKAIISKKAEREAN